jgi:hypothetical protein
LAAFLRRSEEMIHWVNANLSPDSAPALHHLVVHECWTALADELVSQTHFKHVFLFPLNFIIFTIN